MMLNRKQKRHQHEPNTCISGYLKPMNEFVLKSPMHDEKLDVGLARLQSRTAVEVLFCTG